MVRRCVNRHGLGKMLNEIIFGLHLFLSNPDNLVMLGYVCGGAFLCLVATGMTNTIIIYRDVADFVWSLAIVLAPFGTLGDLPTEPVLWGSE